MFIPSSALLKLSLNFLPTRSNSFSLLEADSMILSFPPRLSSSPSLLATSCHPSLMFCLSFRYSYRSLPFSTTLSLSSLSLSLSLPPTRQPCSTPLRGDEMKMVVDKGPLTRPRLDTVKATQELPTPDTRHQAAGQWGGGAKEVDGDIPGTQRLFSLSQASLRYENVVQRSEDVSVFSLITGLGLTELFYVVI